MLDKKSAKKNYLAIGKAILINTPTVLVMPMKRLLAILLLLSVAMAAQVINHEIRINLQDDGSAYVEQEYLLRLAPADKPAFESLIANGAKFGDLAPYGIGKVITYPSTDENVVIELTKSDFGVVVLQYTVGEIVEPVEKVGKQELTGITEKAFTFYDGKTISLPYDPPTTLKIGIPLTLKLAREVTPPAYSVTTGFDANGKKITYYVWNYKKPFTSGKFRVLYEKEVSLQSQLSLRSLTTEFKDKYGNPAYLIAGAILLGIVIWYRKELSMLITESFGGEPTMEEDE